MPREPKTKLGPDEHVITAWAESCAGPGWANQPVWVLVQDATGKLRIECLQPCHQSSDMLTIFGFSSLASIRMKAAATEIMSGWRKRRSRV